MRPELALRFIEIIYARLKVVEELLERMAYGSVRQRLLYLLCKLSEKFKRDIPVQEEDADSSWVQLEVDLTHQELARMAGSLRETVTVMMNELAAEGIVHKEGPRKRLWIHADRQQAALPSLDRDYSLIPSAESGRKRPRSDHLHAGLRGSRTWSSILGSFSRRGHLQNKIKIPFI